MPKRTGVSRKTPGKGPETYRKLPLNTSVCQPSPHARHTFLRKNSRKTGPSAAIISKRVCSRARHRRIELMPPRLDHTKPLANLPQTERTGRMSSCMAKTKNGSACMFPCQRQSRYCFAHDPDPEIQRRRTQARVLGGRNRQRFARRIGEDTRLETVGDIADLSVQALGELEAGRLDIRSATAVLFGCKTALDASAMAGRDTQGVSDRGVSAWTLDLELAALNELIAGQRRSSRPRSALERLRDYTSRVSGRV